MNENKINNFKVEKDYKTQNVQTENSKNKEG